MIKRIAIGLSVTLLALTSACGSDSGGSGSGSDDPYRILFIGPVSGPAAAITEAQVSGLEAGIETINASGGIDGRQVELVVKDDQLDPTKAISLLQAELSGDVPDLVIPGVTSDEGLAILPVLTQQKIFSMGALVSDAVNDTEKYPYFFSVGQGLRPAANVLAKKIVEDGHTTIAFVRADSANGASALATFEDSGKQNDLEVKDYSYNPTSVDLTDVVQRAAADDPDAIVLEGYGASVGYLLQARQKLKLEIPTYGDLPVCLSNPSSLLPPEALEGFLNVCPNVLTKAAEESAAFQDFRSAVGDTDLVLPITQYTAMYDAMIMLQAAADEAGSTETEALSEAMLNLPDDIGDSLATYSGWSYTDDDHQVIVPEKDYSVTESTPIKNGQFVPTS